MDMVEVEWVDSCRVFLEWTENPEDAIKEYEDYSTTIHSVGYLAGDFKDRIILIGDDGHDQISRGMIIPKVSIKSITPLQKQEATNGIHDRNQYSE